MKKYLQLTSTEAIRHFLLKDNSIPVSQSSVEVSIVMPTHYTKPDYEMDVILLKNLMVETETALSGMLDKRQVAAYMENIKEAEQAIDYSHNTDSLVMYANEHFATVVKLPVSLPAGIMIGASFDLRPLYKTRQQNRRYYILTISRNVIRLIEAFNDKVVEEVNNNDFPFVNHDYYVDEAVELAQDSFIDNQIKEFFNDADKRFQHYYNRWPLPVILAGDSKMTAYYEEQMDKEDMVIATVHGSFDQMPFHEIIRAVHPELEKYREEKQKEYLDKLDAANSAYILSTDLNEIYKSTVEGAAATLYVGENFSLNGTIREDHLEVTEKEPGDVNDNDILSEVMKAVRDNGGNTIFVEDERMQQYKGAALIRRY